MQIILNVEYQGWHELSRGITYMYSVKRKTDLVRLYNVFNSGDKLDLVEMFYGEIDGSNMRLVPCEKSEFAPAGFDREIKCSRSTIFRYYANRTTL